MLNFHKIDIVQFIVTWHYIFTNYFPLILQSMKQEISSEAITINMEGHETHKQKIQKKRKIRKQKVQSGKVQYIDLRSIDTSKLSRQEKARVQKAKNREAAQRSRDMHRDYVNKLQKQIREMKELLVNSRKICWKCQKQMDQITTNEINSFQQNLDEKIDDQHKCFSLEKQQLHNMNHYPQIRDNNFFEEQQSFLRVSDNSESYPYMKMMLFVCMVVAVVFTTNAYTENVQERALMQLKNRQQIDQIQNQPQNPIQIKSNALLRPVGEDEKNKTAIVKVQKQQYGLIALKSDDCLNSLMKLNDPAPDTKRSLTSYRDSNLNSNYLAHHQGILLCQVRTPKPYNPDLSQLRTPLVRLYLLGSQIKELITNFGLMVPLMDSNIQLTGIYQVLAKIKQVNMVTNHNCLL